MAGRIRGARQLPEGHRFADVSIVWVISRLQFVGMEELCIDGLAGRCVHEGQTREVKEAAQPQPPCSSTTFKSGSQQPLAASSRAQENMLWCGIFL
jgi:hypothetical protein